MTDVYIFAEGRTERLFIERLLCPHCSAKGVYLHATLVHGQRNRLQGGGDVKFERIHADIAAFLKQRPDTLVATFVDFYGIKEWPNLDRARELREPADIARLLNAGAVEQMQALHPDIEHIPERYIPYTAVHEFESLLMSAPVVLAKALGVPTELVQNAIDQAGGPEYVNNSPQTAPSKRLQDWSRQGIGSTYRKTVQGVTIAEAIGIPTIRSACPLFDTWLKQLGV